MIYLFTTSASFVISLLSLNTNWRLFLIFFSSNHKSYIKIKSSLSRFSLVNGYVTLMDFFALLVIVPKNKYLCLRVASIMLVFLYVQSKREGRVYFYHWLSFVFQHKHHVPLIYSSKLFSRWLNFIFFLLQQLFKHLLVYRGKRDEFLYFVLLEEFKSTSNCFTLCRLVIIWW